jgi:hypothetical protein
MRKVLLATTALVALNVSAASADVSIGGSYEYEFINANTGTTQAQDGNITITGTGSNDAGLSFTVVGNYSIFGNKTGDGNVVGEDSYVDVSGDFGTIRFGQGPNVFDQFDGVMGTESDIETEGGTGTNTLADDKLAVNYVSPAIGGLTVGLYQDAENDEGGVAAKYSMSGFTVYYGSKESTSNFGVGTSLGPIGINAGASRVDGGAKAQDLAISYSIDNMKVVALTQKNTDAAGAKTTYKSVGANYDVGGGLAVAVEASDSGTTNRTWVGVRAKF